MREIQLTDGSEEPEVRFPDEGILGFHHEGLVCLFVGSIIGKMVGRAPWDGGSLIILNNQPLTYPLYHVGYLLGPNPL